SLLPDRSEGGPVMSSRPKPTRVVCVCIAAVLTVVCGAAVAAGDGKLRVISEKSAGGFAFPDSAAYDPKVKVVYMGQFGGDKLDTTAKDGNGKISKLSVDGKVIEERFLPSGGEKLNKPKGIWVHGNRLWVTDIDALWI